MDEMRTNEAIAENEDGSYSIFIKRELCEKKRIHSFYHALRHIKECDFEKKDVQAIEVGAHWRG